LSFIGNIKSLNFFHLEITKIIKNNRVVLLIDAKPNRVKCTGFESTTELNFWYKELNSAE
jgi:hypothetical protein